MSDALGHYFEVPDDQVDPARREAVAIVLPVLAGDLGLAGLGCKGGLAVRWFRRTTRTQYAVSFFGAPPVETFVAGAGLKGLCRGGDPDGQVWLDADLPVTLDQDGLIWTLAHEAMHAQAFLRPRRAYDVVGEASCELYAQKFLRRLLGAEPDRPKAAAPAARSWGPGSPTWRIPWQYQDDRPGDGASHKDGPPGVEYGAPQPIRRVR